MNRLQVIDGGKSASRETLREFYERHGPAVRSRCQYLLKDRSEAEDAMHEVFARALQNLETYRGAASPLTWLLTIATHHCLNQIRASKAAWRKEIERVAQLQNADESAPRSLEGRDLVRALLLRFDTETQAAAIHYYVDEMTLEEVAQAIGRSIPTVRKRLAEFAATAREHAEQLAAPTAPKEESHG